VVPADDEPKRNGQNDSQSETPGHAEEGSDDVFEEKSMAQEVGKGAYNLPWAGQQLARMSHDGYLPDRKQ
jgi:hypothetical protein